MGSEAVLNAEGAGKRFGDLAALCDVSLQVNRGEIVGLVGPNGAGKTTFLKSVIGLIRLSSGRIRVEGLDAAADPVAVRSRTGYLPGESNLYPGMTGRQFLDFCLADYPDLDRPLGEEMAARFELPLEKKVRKYSTGMRRKLLLIQALAPCTPLTLLDEPTDSLDPASRIYLLVLLRKFASQGRAILFSSHQLDEMERTCDRIVLLYKGKVIACETAETVRGRAARLIRVGFAAPMTADRLRLPGVKTVIPSGGKFLIEVEGDPLDVIRELSRLPIDSLDYRSGNLTDLYAELYGVKS